MRLYTPYSLSRGAPSATRSRFRNDVIVTCFFAGFGKTMILFRLVETEGGVQSAHGQLQVLLVDDDGGLDLGGGDHLDVHAFLAQCTEHGGCHAHMAAHADADDADLGDVGVADDFGGTQGGHDFVAQQLHGALVVALADGEAEVGFAFLADVLDDHIDFDVGISHRTQDAVDRKSTRLNSSHLVISYAVFCLKKKKI